MRLESSDTKSSLVADRGAERICQSIFSWLLFKQEQRSFVDSYSWDNIPTSLRGIFEKMFLIIRCPELLDQ